MNHFKQLSILKTDITILDVDAIVNAANASLLGGGGVDGAIHRAAGKALLVECQEIRKTKLQHGLPTGKAVLTKGYNLPAKYVIHTVGPIWNGGVENEAQLLADCYKNTLNLCVKNEITSVAFPAISTGVYGYPKEKAVRIAINTVLEWLKSSVSDIKVIFALINDNYEIYQKYLESII